ncbi:NAD(P)H-dependent glycerol-3-phosphate dehydrogenase [Sphingosinicella soli]|uniref:Glycerol-3-phosphate dehydrogenase [NAD(P)+] n=1 Tax=Sphingosinicella soli TaxID=333708 RepID=A0A7W7F5Q7_9SPHN|nr:NAD(P)H-dependent glycerol-3-phosphate dehydrogenase [Sphingosinicella soli]MBB4631551.1 glycerol-3-phosphate dehydrogenase (NAD(P)+) [Sphingosinicella soli]
MKVGVIGGGAWGTALAEVAASGGDVLLWAREPEVVQGVNTARENTLFLPGVRLSETITATSDLGALGDCDMLLVVAPAQHVRSVLERVPSRGTPIVLCAKGIEAATRKLVGEVAADVLPGAPLAVLSGPTFAREVAMGLPTAITFACADRALADRLMARIAAPRFRPYWTDDVIGAEVGGAIKNVLAIACGVVVGRKLGENARAALISRGFAEMLRFGIAKGARSETMRGLSGLGDLVLTCSSTQSRNFSLGYGLGEGKSARDLLSDRLTVAEGAFTAPVLDAAADELGIDMPITRAVCSLLDGSASVDAVIADLLSRPLRDEDA